MASQDDLSIFWIIPLVIICGHESMAGMRAYKHWTTGDKAMIAALSFAIILALALGVFTVVSMAMHTYDVRSGWRALVGFAIFILISYGAIRKRLAG
jgi:hypothetical protein